MAAATATAPATSNGNPSSAPAAPAVNLGGGAAGAQAAAGGAQFREIHKNTWLKRLTADGKRLTVGPKKSECTWVVFCVHDDTDALLEGYAEPRQAAGHLPEWSVSLREALHISHALIPNSHEFEFVVTLSNEVLRFHAVSWEIMQEWVETLRSKLREMKILSPRENLYTKLPEVRAPLLPTRDPTSPLPPPPPVPAALVPGVERVVVAASHHQQPQQTLPEPPSSPAILPPTAPAPTAMSNTLTQHLLNMLSDPISTYSEQISESSAAAAEEEDVAAAGRGATTGEATQTTSDTDLNLSDDEFLSPLLRKACVLTENGVRVDVSAATAQRASADQILNLEHMLQCERLIPRPQTSRSMSAGAADKSKRAQHKPLCFQSSSVAAAAAAATTSSVEEPQDNNITIIQVSNPSNNGLEQPPELPPKNAPPIAEVFSFPEAKGASRPKPSQPQEYKSNVQIIPSNASSSTIQVLGQQAPSSSSSSNAIDANGTQVSSSTTKVKVLSSELGEGTTVAVYGTCYPPPSAAAACSSSCSSSSVISATSQGPKIGKKIILSADTSGITNISVNSEQSNDSVISGNVHYEKVFLSSSIPIIGSNSSHSPVRGISSDSIQLVANGSRSPALTRRQLAATPAAPAQLITPARPIPRLTRGLTELVISSRPSRRDLHYLKQLNTPLKTSKALAHKSSSATNNNIEQQSQNQSTPSSSTNSPQVRSICTTMSEDYKQRRRSSSTSDAQGPLQRIPPSSTSGTQRNANNNEFTPSRSGGVFRMQPPPQGTPPSNSSTNPSQQQSPNKRFTLREQQVMQLRREIIHPGGVRLNLRRKDCVGSIAWVDAFGGVWIAGWKQKEHPVLYNALHIGDQLLSIAGVSISSAVEANKIIRNSNTLFVEVLLRRIPFGRAYAIRRDREGQCLGLIRDGNTSTIVDVVPNSLAARHGLPPKTQSCDGSSLTFWMLTEINGRPLNLFFKDLEIRDRLNSVGRDISILVQPSDLVTKLKKQLKSLRGYKDYLVQ